jgi:uncharacterized protein (DUF433 family)
MKGRAHPPRPFLLGFSKITVMDWTRCNAVDQNPAKVGGVWCFRGTRVQVASLFEHLDRGSTIDEYLDWFPAVSREQAHDVLRFAKTSLDQHVAVR